MNAGRLYSREKSEHELQDEQAHRDEAEPGVQRVEVRDRRVGQVVRVPDGQEAEADARDRQSVEERVRQLGVDVAQAPAQSVQHNRCESD